MEQDRNPERILCGVSTRASEDGRLDIMPSDVRTAEQALLLASRTGARVRFVHAVDWVDLRRDGPDVIELVEKELSDDWQGLARAAADLGVPIDREVRRGKPWRELVDAAQDWKADLIVVSPRRSDVSFTGRIVHGSTAKRLLNESPCPVWIVSGGTTGVRRVLALIDRSEMSSRVVSAARSLAKAFGAKLHALYCLEYPDDAALHRLRGAAEEIARYHREERQRAWDDLERLTDDGETRWSLSLGEDWVVRQAPKVVADKEIDLVVLAGRSKPALAGKLGTTAQKLLDRMDASVWVIRP